MDASRFVPAKRGGQAYSDLADAKRAAKAAKAATVKGGPKPRDLLKQRAAEMYAQKNAEKGSEKKGWW